MVGRHIRVANTPWQNAGRIIGIVADAKEDGLDAPPYPFAYMCLQAGAWPDPEYVVRTTGDPHALIGTVRQAIKDAAPSRAIFGVQTLDDVLTTSLDKPRLNAEMVGLFAASALLLAAVGLYSLVMLTVTAQTKEIGVRVALGATPGRIASNVVADAARPVLAGLAGGALLAAVVIGANAKFIRGELFGVSFVDGVTLAEVGIALAGAAILAALIPARRAAGIDPLAALREE